MQADNQIDYKHKLCRQDLAAKKLHTTIGLPLTSNTNNPNVICELSLKKQTQNPNDLHSFEEIMKIQKED